MHKTQVQLHEYFFVFKLKKYSYFCLELNNNYYNLQIKNN